MIADIEDTVLPYVIGSDIGCGMRMIILENSTADQLSTPALDRHLRQVFFQDGDAGTKHLS